ncbi:MAG: hypothetical protein ACFFHD_10255 [Promethearchaeota archaeon]
MEDCFDKILELYNNRKMNRYEILIEIMNDLENELSNAIKVKNCLIFLINLCFEFQYPDYVHNKGKEPNKLSEVERYELQDLLRAELNN